ncbi:MAG: hypothetical protein N3E37_04480 [Candidatus Micrarchaeota archaeon]|nr:hypothetical protein [Candidatus Micrarchaeota archaeon]
MVFDIIKKIFKPGLNEDYAHLISWLNTKIVPGNEGSVLSQLQSIKSQVPENKRKAFQNFIDSKVWKDAFVKSK